MQQPWTLIKQALPAAGIGTVLELSGLPWWALAVLALAALALSFVIRLATLVLPQDSADRTQLLLEWLHQRRRTKIPSRK
jgi:hypothetical protein